MADYDLKSNLVSKDHYPYASIDATPSVTGTDTFDYGSVTFQLWVGAGGITFTTSNKIEFIVYESDASGSGYTAAPDVALILDTNATAPGDTGIVRSIIAAHGTADATLTTVGYRGKKRYVKCVPTYGGTHSSPTPVRVGILLGHPYHAPITASSVEV